MKKIVLSTLLIVLALSACGSKQQDEGTTNAALETEQENVSTNQIEEEIEHRTGEEIIGISSLDISDIKIQTESSVRNDSTGNWRLSRFSENINFYDYALSYYNEYFNEDSEVHAIINFANSTTISMSVISGYALDISIYEYVDKEEHDANLLFSGMHLEQYFIYLDNGDIEKI